MHDHPPTPTELVADIAVAQAQALAELRCSRNVAETDAALDRILRIENARRSFVPLVPALRQMEGWHMRGLAAIREELLELIDKRGTENG